VPVCKNHPDSLDLNNSSAIQNLPYFYYFYYGGAFYGKKDNIFWLQLKELKREINT
jgi:hypothetical protein